MIRGRARQADIQDMSRWYVPPRGATYVVAASDAEYKARSLADYTCDGTADDVEIQAALNQCLYTGGTVQLTEGTFNLTAALQFPAGPAQLVGADYGSRAPGLAANPMSTVLSWAGAGATVTTCLLFSNDDMPQMAGGFEMVGDGVDTDHGIRITSGCVYKSVRSVAIRGGMVVDGVYVTAGAAQNVFEDVIVQECPIGFDVNGYNNSYLRCKVLRAQLGGTAGFEIHSIGSDFISCTVFLYAIGFDISESAEAVQLFGCKGTYNNQHIIIDRTASVEPVGVLIAGFHGNEADEGTGAAILIDYATDVTLLNCYIKDTDSNKAIELTVNADSISILGGWTDDTTPITNAGATNLVVRNFKPWVHEASGATSVADGGTIAHGLSGTPTKALISGVTTGDILSVTSLDGTNITVAKKDEGGGAGTTSVCYWWASL